MTDSIEAVRAAMANVTLDEIKEHHGRDERSLGFPYDTHKIEMHSDRGALLAHADSQAARIQKLEKALTSLMPYFEGEHHPDHPDVVFAREALNPVRPR